VRAGPNPSVYARRVPTYRGSCHCGRIRFEADGEIAEVQVCNCSICQRTGYLHWPVPPERFRLLAGAEDYATYQFGTRVAKHHFCRSCGISPFRVARSDPDDIDVNVRCLEGVDIEALAVSRFDGQNWEREMANRR
jgi:hypothetical protein